MPIKIPDALPARAVLESENIFVMTEKRAMTQDIRPLRIAILNLMPTKVATETQLLRRLSYTPLQVEIDLLHTISHQSKNTSEEHLASFYKTFDQIREKRYDGMIITGAPVENMEFEEVDYWPELCEIFDWAHSNVYSVLNICWAAQAALYYRYGIPKYQLEKKMFGVFRHRVLDYKEPLLHGFNDNFSAPHSRHTEVRAEDIRKHPELRIISDSEVAGVYIVMRRDGREFYVTGHSEYDADTLAREYFRDKEKGLDIDLPVNYFPDDIPTMRPPVTWRSSSTLLFTNWLNYYVYQTTPYDLRSLEQSK